MCLNISKKTLQKTKEAPQTGIQIFWKVVTPRTRRSIVIGLRSLYRSSLYEIGFKKSDRKTKEITNFEKNMAEVDQGIHVYTSLREAQKRVDCQPRNRALLPVQCNMRDLVAFGMNKEAVFTKVRVLAVDYRRAIKELN